MSNSWMGMEISPSVKYAGGVPRDIMTRRVSILPKGAKPPGEGQNKTLAELRD